VLRSFWACHEPWTTFVFAADQVRAGRETGRRYDAVIVCARRHRFRNPTEIRIE
jgi:hypothetical protein